MWSGGVKSSCADPRGWRSRQRDRDRRADRWLQMDGQTDSRQMDRWTVRKLDTDTRQTDRQTDGQADRWAQREGRTGRQQAIRQQWTQKDRKTDGQTAGRQTDPTHRRTERKTRYNQADAQTLPPRSLLTKHESLPFPPPISCVRYGLLTATGDRCRLNKDHTRASVLPPTLDHSDASQTVRQRRPSQPCSTGGFPPWQYGSLVWMSEPFWSWYMQATSRRWKPRSHVTEQAPHSPATHLEQRNGHETAGGGRGGRHQTTGRVKRYRHQTTGRVKRYRHQTTGRGRRGTDIRPSGG